MSDVKRALKSAAVWMAMFSIVILIAGCHGGKGTITIGGPGGQIKAEVEVGSPPPPWPPSYGGDWYWYCPEGPDGPCYLTTPPHGPIEPLDPDLLPPGPEGEVEENPGIQHLPITDYQSAGGQQMVSIGVSHVEAGGDAGVMEILTEEGPVGPQTPQTVTLSTDLNVVFHNPSNSPYIQTTPDGGLKIMWDSEGLEGETLDTLLNEPVTVSMLVPAEYNPFDDYDSQEEEGGMVSVSLDGSVLGCIQTLMDHGFKKLSFGEGGSLVRSGSSIVGTLYLEDDQGTLVPYDVNIPL
ncbi:MAG: hypothetical protein JXB13_09145 [Phycisphaerae bacterium]|nr:hypothetical protein [Phycisphaerae bacterium]